ncbi:MAG: hypothetical protein ACRCT2_13865 [Plesiomonas shigelloides]
MSLEIILDIVLSVIVLAIYHSDCDRPVASPEVAEFPTTEPEAYEHTVVPAMTEPIDEWAIEDEALAMTYADEVQSEVEAVHFGKPIDPAYITHVDYTAAWYAEIDSPLESDDPSLDGPIEIVPLTPEAIAACTHLSTDPIEPISLGEYQAMSGRKLKALAKELSIAGWSRMKQPQLAIAVHQATIDRDGYPDD